MNFASAKVTDMMRKNYLDGWHDGRMGEPRKTVGAAYDNGYEDAKEHPFV